MCYYFLRSMKQYLGPEQSPEQKVSDMRPVFVVTYDPSISAIQHKHWRAMIDTDQYTAEVFPEPENNIGEYLIKMQQAMSSMSFYNGRERGEK